MFEDSFDTPGTYEIRTSEKNTDTVEADSLSFDGDSGDLLVWKDAAVVARFRWWNTIVKKADA